MAKLSRKKGIQSQILHVFIQDSSATTGAGLAGLAFDSASLACRYINAGGTLSGAITLQTITTLGTYEAPTANTNMRFKEVSSASPSQGIYEIHLHNDWMNLTGGSLVIMLAGATNMAQFRLEIDLQADTNVTHVAGTAQTAGDLKASITEVNDKTSQLNFTAATYVMADIQAISTDTTAATSLETMLDGTGGNTLTATISGNLSGNVTGSIGSLGTNAKIDVNTEVDTALADVNLDHIAGTATAIPAIPAGTYIDQMMDDGTAVYDRTTDSLQAIRDTAPLGTAMRGTDNAYTGGNITGNLSGSVGSVTGAVGSVTGDVGGNVTGSVGSIASNGINNNSLHPNACSKITDSGIQRGASNWENNSDDRSLGWAISKLVNKIDLNAAGDTLTIRKSNDSTALFTQAVTTSGGAAPVVSLDTA